MAQARNAELKHNLDASDISEFLSAYLFVKSSKPRQDGTISQLWYLRITLSGDKRIERALKVQHIDDRSTELAIDVGEEKYSKIKQRYLDGLTEEEKDVITYGTEFLADAKKSLEENKKLVRGGYDPIHRNILTGKMLWDDKNYNQQVYQYQMVIKPFFGRDKYKKPIAQINPRDIREWDSWRKLEARKNKEPWSPSTIQKQNTCLRFIFKWAELQGERFTPPALPEMPKNLALRRRPDVDDDTFKEIYSYLRDRNGMNPESEVAPHLPDWKKDNYYVFYCYLEMLEHFGIRGGVGTNPVKMEDIKREEDKEGQVQFYLRRVEKNRDPYEAAGYRYFDKTWNRLNRFYEGKGIYDRTYLFEHWKDRGKDIERGDPIKSFRKAWNTMAEEIGFNQGTTDTTKKIVPYSIRHRYIGRRLMESGANPIIIAKSVGTSLQMIDKIYLHYEVRKNYDKLVQTEIDHERLVDIYDTNGMVRRIVNRNSPAHWEEWRANKDLVEYAPRRSNAKEAG